MSFPQDAGTIKQLVTFKSVTYKTETHLIFQNVSLSPLLYATLLHEMFYRWSYLDLRFKALEQTPVSGLDAEKPVSPVGTQT